VRIVSPLPEKIDFPPVKPRPPRKYYLGGLGQTRPVPLRKVSAWAARWNLVSGTYCRRLELLTKSAMIHHWHQVPHTHTTTLQFVGAPHLPSLNQFLSVF